MSVINIAVPVIKGILRLEIAKGRQWSVVEELLLEAIAKSAWTIPDLVKASNLPRRIVMEAVIRLMRAGWVSLEHGEQSNELCITPSGLAVAESPELPAISTRVSRPISFVIDQITATTFRGRELLLYKEVELKKLSDGPLVILQPKIENTNFDVHDLLSIFLDSDERLVSIESIFNRPIRRYALIKKYGDRLEGLPDREIHLLRTEIVEALKNEGEIDADRTVLVPPTRCEAPKELATKPIFLERSDLILGGEAHRDLLISIIKNANSVIYIHSTFINEERFFDLLPHLNEAAEQGVKTHILWGQSDDKDERNSTKQAINRINSDERVRSLSDNLKIHPFSTNSHAKIICADSGEAGKFIGVVGSCNWFSSGFTSYDVSVVLKEQAIVSDVAQCLFSMVHDGCWHLLANELLLLTERLRQFPSALRENANACIVLGHEHSQLVLKARDEAKSQIFLLSHRLGPASENAIITPAKNTNHKDLLTNIYFARTTGAVKNPQKREIIKTASPFGVNVEPIAYPRLHAKVLAWDSDFAVITSQNWLSATPIDSNDPCEVGVYINMKDIANIISQDFEQSRARHPTES